MAIVTRDPAVYADLAAALRERRLPSVSLLPGQRIPERVAVVLTGPGEAAGIPFGRVIAVEGRADRASLWAEVQLAIAGGIVHDLVVGIDPGPRPGYAVLSDAGLLVRGTLESPENAGTLGAQLQRRFAHARIRFRVGSGGRLDRSRILQSLAPLHRPIELVDERGTTPRGHPRPRDPESAERIARTRGAELHGLPSVPITPGDVANLQRLSREASEGHFTIPRRLAVEVLEGRISLADALRDGERAFARSGGPRTPRGPTARERY